MKKSKISLVEDKKKALVTVVVGSYRCSFPYYLTRLLTDIKSATLVIDNTRHNELFTIMQKSPDEDLLKHNNTYFVKNRVLREETFEELDKSFTNVIVLVGTNTEAMNKDVLSRADHFVYITGYDRFSRDAFKNTCEFLYSLDASCLSDKNHDNLMIWNDKSPCKVIEKDFESKCRLSVTKRFEIKMSEQNRRSYISLTESGNAKIHPLSADYKDCLFEVADIITDHAVTRLLKKFAH